MPQQPTDQLTAQQVRDLAAVHEMIGRLLHARDTWRAISYRQA